MTKPKPPLTPYQRIMRTARNRTGLRPSAWDVYKLARDHAIASVAEWDDMDPVERERIRREMEAWEWVDALLDELFAFDGDRRG